MQTLNPRLAAAFKTAGPVAVDPQRILFSDALLVFVVLAKPAVDALHEHGAVKYGYMGLLLFAAFFAYVGRRLAGLPGLSPLQSRPYLQHLTVASAYLVFLLTSLALNPGSLSHIFKIVSPFVLFLLAAPLMGGWFVKVLGLSSLMIIVANATLLPLDYGWIQWGGARTFKGFYFFKTDLAYAICFATLSVALWQRFRFTPVLLLAATLGAAQVVLSNSRMNYLLFAAVVLFISLKGGLRLATIVKAAVLALISVAAVLLLFDSRHMIGFDVTDLAGFTQGRNRIWDILLEEGLMSYTLGQWLFGKGLYADLLLAMENTFSGMAHNAHNEWLHLMITQGLVGLALYASLWITMYRFTASAPLPPWSRGVGVFGFLLVILQSMTAVVSSYATKTWPLAFLLLAVAASSQSEKD